MLKSESSADLPQPTATRRDGCTICGNHDLYAFLDLGLQPCANALLRPDQLAQAEPRYPLGLACCRRCGLMQLTHSVPASLLFKGYVYFSSVSQAMVEHFGRLANEVVERFVPAQGLVVEIGSNDGILLQSLLGKPCRILGIDPAETAAAAAAKKGVPTRVDFFNREVAGQVLAEHGPAAAILGNNVLAHIPDLHETMQGFEVLMAPDGVLVFEFPYAVDFIDHVEFDTVYHEHMYYLGLQPLSKLLGQYGFEIFDVSRQPVHGGSIRVFANRKSAGRSVTAAVRDLQELEASRGISALEQFASRVRDIREQLRATIQSLRDEGKRIAGYTAPAKGTVLLNYCELDLIYLADATPAKQGLYCPGVRIPIVSPERFREDNPDYALLLAWNHKAEVLRREAPWHDAGGRFIIPVPEVAIV
ncbi:MAG: methyltransferase domain-containing protein [Candidatus Xenobia bacterium]